MLDWTQVEKYFDQGNTSGFVVSLLESEKLLQELLLEKKFPGKNTDEKLNLAKKYLSSPQIFEQARNLTKQLRELNLPKHITQQTAEQILRTYFTATTELSHVPGSEIRKNRFTYLAGRTKSKLTKIILYLIISAFAAMLLTAFFSDTKSGQVLAQKLEKFTEVILYKALPLAAACVLVILAIAGISLNKRRRAHVQQQKS